VSAEKKQIRIQTLTELTQFDRCVELQLLVWGYDDGDLIPKRVFLVADRIGGVVLGAFDGEVMIGFSMGLPGFRNGHAYLHSHMLAVLPEYRNYGIGRTLKLAQRDEALAKGFDLMEWTFDPMEIKNAYLNITRLGAISRRYKENFYGPSSSPLQGGLPTDRLYAEWWLKSHRVETALKGGTPEREVQETVLVPQEKSLEVQMRNREALQQAFARGLSILGYERTAEGDGRFLLGQWNEDLAY
jgi:predicted GNAT superfamily acetyltransferase